MARRSTTSPAVQSTAEVFTDYKVGDKVRVVQNHNRYLTMPPGTMGKEGRVTGSITPHSCRVKIAYGEEVWVEFREMELVKATTEKPVAVKAPTTRKRKS